MLGDQLASDIAERDIDAWAVCERTLALKGYQLTGAFRTLFSPHWAQNGTRRSARLLDAYEEDDARYQVSAKLFESDNADDPDLLQLRIWIAGQGWAEFVLT